ncbi:CRISPR-associated protein Cas5 [Bacillus sp. FSL W8-0102]|uniref:CRISPR-associated protein Cas5 n=1 Tax=Bacillus sp. FSL W8-0102 TaxID=2978205 RepID=UPI0030FC2A8E
MKAVVFDVKGTIAHFRRPDTTATHLTYPFITPTAAKGMVGAILGITDFVTNDQVGIQLLNPVRTSAQQLSMIKDGGNAFNRPTTIELLVQPAYRIYYVGKEYVEELADKLEKGQSVFPTYLGTAYALSFPKFVFYENSVSIIPPGEKVETKTVVPVDLIGELIFQEDRYLSRAGGFLKDYLGERNFEKSLSYIYEKNGQSIAFQLKEEIADKMKVAIVGGESVCLV